MKCEINMAKEFNSFHSSKKNKIFVLAYPASALNYTDLDTISINVFLNSNHQFSFKNVVWKIFKGDLV